MLREYKISLSEERLVYLLIRRRRWRHKSTKKEISSDYSFIAEGARLTQEEAREDTISNIASHYGVKADKLQRHYKKHSSGFNNWEQKSHAADYMVFPENMGDYLSIDEVVLSQGELYTFLTNKAGKGKKGDTGSFY